MKEEGYEIKENERLKDLISYAIMDSCTEEDYDYLTFMASQICDTNTSLITLIDKERQWFKSRYNFEITETPREFAFCTHAFDNPHQPLIVHDARKDPRFYNNPLVTDDPYIVFYAGIPLLSENGNPLGNLCVIDHEPKKLSDNQIYSLQKLARQVMNLFELRKKNLQLEKSNKDLIHKNKELEQFAYIASHDIKSPLVNIISLCDFLIEYHNKKIESDVYQIIELIRNSSLKVNGLIEGILYYSQANNLSVEDKSNINIEAIEYDLANKFGTDESLYITFNSDLYEIFTNKNMLEQILSNLISNAIKFNNKENIIIEIGISEDIKYYHFYVKDNGPGIYPEKKEEIFLLFEKLTNSKQLDKSGNGIGLAIVYLLVKALGGEVWIDESYTDGAKFNFTLEK